MTETSPFGTFGRYQETPVGDMSADMKDAYEFTMQLRGQVPGPHKIWLSNPALSKTVVPIGAYYQTRSTLTKAEIEIATNLVNGRWLAAYSNYEHEMIAEDAGGLPSEKVEAMIAGLPTSFDDPRQQVVYELVSALVAPRVVPMSLYRRAKALLGDAGIVDVTMLLDPADLNDAQKAVYDRLANTMVRWADQAGFQSTTDGGKLIGPFNPVLFDPGITPAFLDLQDA